jgi:uncharacterized protein (TIGR03435 family)
MRSIATTLFLLGGSAVFAQNPTFEVASIKPAAPQTEGRFMVQMGGDPGRIDYKNVSLRDLVRNAYGVKDYQVVAPDWMMSARYDVQAKLPPDTPQEQRNLMLQQLLADRFLLKTHKESKEVPIYSLVVGKNGPKLKKAAEQPAPTVTEAPATGSGPGTASGPAAGGGGRAAFGGGPGAGPGGRGPGGPGGRGGAGMIMMRMEGPGKLRLTANATTTSNLADMIARQVDRPVFDDTKLTDRYDVELEFKPENGAGMMKGMPMMMPHGDGGGGDARGPAPDGVEAPSIFTAVQDQLGLKLEAKKGPIETIVVDHSEKTPTEN